MEPQRSVPARVSSSSVVAPPPRGGEAPLHPEALKLLDQLKQDPNFVMVQEMVRQNRQVLQDTVQGILQANPMVALYEPRLGRELEQVLLHHQQANAQQSFENLSPMQRRMMLMQQAQDVFRLTPPQLKAVLDLESLGFGYDQALEAFLVCERSQELAANFLLEGQHLDAAEALGGNVGPSPIAGPGPPSSSRQAGSAASQVPSSSQVPNLSDVALTLPDWEAIQRISELGFDRQVALQAYLAANRNEELAADQLLQ